jgi:rhodanese-related sulfurtransferase
MSMGVREMVQEALASIEAVSARDVRDSLDSGQVDLVVDVREPKEWEGGHVPGAINVPRGMLELRADPESPATDPTLSADKDARVIVYCLKAPGARSVLAARTLGSMGYSNVAAMRGGFEEWQAEGLPAE